MRMRSVFFLVLASASAAQPTPSPESILQTAVAAWHMQHLDDAAGQNPLTVVGRVALGRKLEGAELRESLASGNDGVVADFDGGYLDAGQGTAGALNLTGPALTVSVRLRSPAATWELPLFSKHDGHERLVYNLYSLSSEIGFELGTRGAAGVARTKVHTGRIGATDWHTIICRYDGARLQMFVDGVMMDEAFPTGPLREGNTAPCLIGAESVGGRVKTGWKGQMDHVAIWRRALADSEIASLNGGPRRIAARKQVYLKDPPLLPPRADLYREKYRPQFHVTARQWTLHKLEPVRQEEGWINDVNGLIHHQGQYHLFAQRWARCWLHFVSTDLVHWTELQPAFWEDKRFGSGVQSGTIVFDRENVARLSADPRRPPLVAFWSGFDNRSQCIAYSVDHGRSWTKYANNPYMIRPERDPKVFWHEPSRKWVMVLYADSQYHLLNSTNLLNWTDLKNPLPDCFECPDLFPLPLEGNRQHTKWVLVRGNGKYSVGQFDGTRFTPETGQLPCDLGANFYATQSWGDIPGQPGRRVQIAWMRDGAYPGMPFNQQLSFPCDLTLRSFPEGPRLCRLPAAEISRLYARKHTWRDLPLKAGPNPFPGVPGELIDLHLQAALGGARELAIRCGGQTVTYSAAKHSLACLGREAPIDTPQDQLTLRLLVDRTSIEVFGQDGKTSMSFCFLPQRETGGLEIHAEGGQPVILALTVNEMKSMWPARP